MKTINFLGCGRLGKTLGHLWARHKIFKIGSVLTTSYENSKAAVDFIGCGQIATSIEQMNPADIWLLATPDDCLQVMVDVLAGTGLIQPDQTVFHCSGAVSFTILQTMKSQGAMIASIHPVKSFADPKMSVDSFDSTWCGFEGDGQALTLLTPAFEAIGGHVFPVDPTKKTMYHTANVMVCNNLIGLIEAGMELFEQAGIPRDKALQITAPIIKDTLENVSRLGTTDALTGPVARGDIATIERHLDSLLNQDDHRLNELYRLLGSYLVDLTIQKQTVEKVNIEKMLALFGNSDLRN